MGNQGELGLAEVLRSLLSMLEVRPSGSKWAPIDRREHGDPVAGVHHRFSVGVERAGGVGWSTAELSGHLLKYPE